MAETSAPSQKLVKAAPWLIFAAALLLRLWGIGWGLPNERQHWSFHPDEPSIYIYSRQVEPLKGDFVPEFFNYGTLYLSALRLTGDFAEKFAGESPEPWMLMGATHVAGRWINVLAGAGTVLVLFLMLRRRVGDAGAVFGSLLVAFAPAHVIHSRFQTVDVLATFFLALSAHFALKLLPEAEDEPPVRNVKPLLIAAMLSGAFAGMSAATKYTGILGLATLFAALYFARTFDRMKLVLAGLASALVMFLIFTPGALLNSSRFIQDFQYEMRHTSEGHGLVFIGLPSSFAWHIVNLMVGIGPLLVALGGIGLLSAIWKKHKAAIAIGAFFLLYYLLIGRASVAFLRYTFPLYVGLAFGVGWVVQWSLVRRGWALAVPALGIVGLGGIFGGGLATSAESSLWMAGEDPRDEAARYIRSVSTPETTVGLPVDPWYYTPTFYFDTGAPRMLKWELRDAAMRQAENPKILRFVPPNPEERFDFDVRLFDLKPDYVVITSFETEGYDRLRRLPDKTPVEQLLADRFEDFYGTLKEEYVLDRYYGGTAQRFGVQIHDLEYVRPLIWIWKRKPLTPVRPG